MSAAAQAPAPKSIDTSVLMSPCASRADVLRLIREADAPANDGSGFIVLLKIHSGDFFRGALVGLIDEIDATGKLTLELWEGKPDGGGPIGADLTVDLDKIGQAGIEW
ncbi:hypothetical protein [Burkholderia sp. Ac-20365]|uniref:hypothetical protein n=1 Tax=Burkholderia sp. Ac-20365 TaxID=2703897 RepID=UPI00197C6B77|nr:hypothetical protein [Burkholderia sp. Ac-20365]MBN3760945.1 hypothetical protein [Burkholderia sp. Ac-20365]